MNLRLSLIATLVTLIAGNANIAAASTTTARDKIVPCTNARSSSVSSRRVAHGGHCSKRHNRKQPSKRRKEPPPVGTAKAIPPATAPSGATNTSPSVNSAHGGAANPPTAPTGPPGTTTTPSPPFPTPGEEGGSFRLFAANSIWNAGLSPRAPLDPSSGVRMAAFDELIAAEEKSGIGPWIDETEYSTPLYVVGPGQAKVDVHLGDGPWDADLQNALDEGVPIPAGAQPAAGTDGEMTIYQPSRNTLWEFWRALKTEAGWRASWGGAMQDVSDSPGYYNDASWPGLTPAQGWNWGATATSLPVIAGTIRIAELRAGHIEHALALDIPNACANEFSFPAQRSDGTEESPTCIPEGAHMRLNPSFDLAAIKMSPITRMLAEAAQRHGIVVRDITHHEVSFSAEDPTPTGSNPYTGPSGLFDGLKPWVFLREFPWNQLQLLQMHLCSSAPCLEGSVPSS